MLEVNTRGVDAHWNEYAADEWSDALMAAMKLGGVEQLYFVSGTELSFFQESAVKAMELGRHSPRLVTMMHEHVAINAALGSAMVTGQPSASVVHVDVGTLHYGAGIHSAWRGGYPVLIMGGTSPRAMPGSMRGARDSGIQWVQEPRDQGEIVRQYVKMDHRLEYQDNPGYITSRLLQIAMSEPKGPVYMSVPREMAMMSLPGSTRFPTRNELGLARGSWPDPDDAREIARWLVKSHNPLIMTERVGRDAEAVSELVRLAELLAVPVADSGLCDRLNFPTTHYLYGTGPRVSEADVMLVLEHVSPFIPGQDPPGREARIAWVSQDPVLSRIKTLIHRADLWLSATPANVARAVREAAEGMLDASDLARIADRRERLQQRKREILARDEELAQEAGKVAMPTGRWVGYELGKLLEPDAIVLNDGLSNGGFVQTYARRERPGTYFRSGSSAGGWGSGAAFGAKIARPDRDVVLASGDGFFSFGTPDMAIWAASFHKAPYLSVVFVNGTYSTGTTTVRNQHPEGYIVRTNNYLGGTFDPPPDYGKLAEAAGGYGEYVTETAEVGPALKRGLEQVRKGTPAVIAVRVPGPLQEGIRS